ncbi:MAG: hypothetical protein EBU85_03325, partial [Actinobacteria bacterium]|nr:hypothetical protein [Actinomycetota bacterium]
TLAAGTKTVVTATLTLTSGYLAARGNTSSTIKTLFGQVIATRGDGLVSTVPFSAVPAARSNYSVTSDGKSVTVANRAGAVGSGTAETYEWLMADAQDTPSASDIRSLGAQYWTEADLGLSSSADGFIVFNLSTYNQIYNPADTEWDVYIDTNKDGYDDYLLVGFDAGYMTTGSGSGKIGWFLYYWDNAKGWTSKAGAYSYWAPLNSSTLQFGVQASALGMPASAPGSFQIDGLYAFSWTGETDWTPGISGTIDPYNPQRSYGDWAGGATGLAPGQSTAWGLATRPLAAGETRTLGWVVSTADNRTGMQSTEIRGF